LAHRDKPSDLEPGKRSIPMDTQESATLQLHEIVVWTPDRMRGEVVAKDHSGIQIRWEDGQLGYYQFTELLSQIERSTSAPNAA
jgi:hypothetical protein